MKKTIMLAVVSLGLINQVNAQTGIETKTTSTSAVLEFASGTTKGIILPAIETMPTGSSLANGTFLLDKNDSKIKMRENNTWVELSGTGNITNVVPYSGTSDNGKQTVIGARTTTANGVLVLEAANKALVLPKVANPHLNVKSPYAGMMCYDTTRKALAVFDGTFWNYWK